MHSIQSLTMFFCFALPCLPASYAQAEPRIEPREKWSAVFGESKTTFTFDIKSGEEFTGRLTWEFSANQRTISRDEALVDTKPDKPVEFSIPLQIPPVKDGVIFRADLTLRLYGEADAKALVTLEKPIWIYPQNPFADRTEWLEDLKIRLFDPAGDTANLFDEAEIPYTIVGNLAALTELEDGVVIIGEGNSLIDYRSLSETMLEVAAAGIPVLCLAPAEGSIPLPSLAESELPVPSQMQWKRENAIVDLDKRLDSEAWPGEKMLAARFALDARGGRISAVVDEAKQGWPWLEMQYPDKGSTFLVCGFGIVRGWEDGPTPRFLFARILESLTLKETPLTEE